MIGVWPDSAAKLCSLAAAPSWVGAFAAAGDKGPLR
jgi:hypothetical protein